MSFLRIKSYAQKKFKYWTDSHSWNVLICIKSKAHPMSFNDINACGLIDNIQIRFMQIADDETFHQFLIWKNWQNKNIYVLNEWIKGLFFWFNWWLFVLSWTLNTEISHLVKCTCVQFELNVSNDFQWNRVCSEIWALNVYI